MCNCVTHDRLQVASERCDADREIENVGQLLVRAWKERYQRMISNYNDYGVNLYIHLKAFTNSTTVKFLTGRVSSQARLKHARIGITKIAPTWRSPQCDLHVHGLP